MNIERSAGIVVFTSQAPRRYLLLKHAAGHWSLPKGHVEEGEAEEETARRELAEETGISGVALVPGFREEVSYSFKRNGKAVSKTVAFFLGSASPVRAKLSFEHSDSAWLPAGEAMARLTYDADRNLLHKAEAFLAAQALP